MSRYLKTLCALYRRFLTKTPTAMRQDQQRFVGGMCASHVCCSRVRNLLSLVPVIQRYDGEAGGEAAGPLNLQDEYIKPPPPDYVPPTGQKCALGPLPDGYAAPVSRFVLQDLRAVLALCQTVDTGQGRQPDTSGSHSHKCLISSMRL